MGCGVSVAVMPHEDTKKIEYISAIKSIAMKVIERFAMTNVEYDSSRMLDLNIELITYQIGHCIYLQWMKEWRNDSELVRGSQLLHELLVFHLAQLQIALLAYKNNVGDKEPELTAVHKCLDYVRTFTRL